MRAGVRHLRQAAVGVMAASLVACSFGGSDWTGPGEDYLAALRAAHGVGFTNLALFYADDVLVDHTGWTGYRGSGRSAAVQSYRDSWQQMPASFGVSLDPQDSVVVTPDLPPYLAADGAIDPTLITTDQVLVPTAWIYRIDAQGVRSETWVGSTASALENEVIDGAGHAAVLARAQAYLHAWGSADASAARSLYARDALTTDSLVGITVRSADAIVRHVDDPASPLSLAGATAGTTDGRGAAVYGTLHGPMVLLVTSGRPCPGEVAIALWFGTDGTVTREARYRGLDSARRCLTPTAGWWDALSIPDPRTVRRTGTLVVRDREVGLWNSNKPLVSLLRWALQRYADAALPVPVPVSVTFLPAAPDARERFGFAASGTADLALTVTARQVCADLPCGPAPPAAKLAALTALAHLWLTRYLTPQRRASFLRAHAVQGVVPAWAADTQDLAAGTIAWGLMDEPAIPAGSPCDSRAADFRILTGASPDPRSCAPTRVEPT